MRTLLFASRECSYRRKSRLDGGRVTGPKAGATLTRQFQLSIEAFAGEARNLAPPYGTLDRLSLVRRFSKESSCLSVKFRKRMRKMSQDLPSCN